MKIHLPVVSRISLPNLSNGKFGRSAPVPLKRLGLCGLMSLALVTFFLPISSASENGTLHGTAIAAVRTPEEIVVAADSRMVDVNDKPVTGFFCKIRQGDHVFFAVHGIVVDAAGGYNVFSILAKAGRIDGSISRKIHVFESMIRLPLERVLQRAKLQEPGAFQKDFVATPPLGVLFFGIENHVLVFHHLLFRVSNSTGKNISLKVEQLDCPGSGCPAGISAVFVGPSKKLKTFQRDHREFWNEDLVSVVKDFVQTEIASNLPSVGPPIDIIRITESGVEWVQHKTECQEIQEP
jgi:hypothetical protein